jgi:predicted TPR repeat methyltransferase
MSDKDLSNVWQAKTVDETIELYAGWADSYDEDVRAWGYATPGRIAEALAAALPDKASSILDFGCGTGVSGRALLERGFTVVDGTDVSAEMIAQAEGQGIYRKLWQSEPGVLDVRPGDYAAIAAMGVISSGAAPPDTLAIVLSALGKGGLLAMSYNDPTLGDQKYTDALQAAISGGSARINFEEYGPHLPQKNMNSRIYIIEKT